MGLRADGIVGPVRPEEIYVDIVAQRVEARRNDRIVFEGPVVVGRPATRTPRLEAELTGVTFNPSWFVSPGIFARTMLPRLRSEPVKLVSEAFVALEQVDGRLVAHDIPSIDKNNVAHGRYILRQNYSPVSALGPIKFEMPNSQTIFLHDTPNRSDFALDERLYSSGCVRVGDIAQLARIALGDDVWSARDVGRRMASDRTFRIDLETRITVKLDNRVATIIAGDVVLREDTYATASSSGS